MPRGYAVPDSLNASSFFAFALLIARFSTLRGKLIIVFPVVLAVFEAIFSTFLCLYFTLLAILMVLSNSLGIEDLYK